MQALTRKIQSFLLYISLTLVSSTAAPAWAQHVGIGTASPRVKLEVWQGHWLIDGVPAGSFPSLGPGRRLQWDQQTGALRIGEVTGTLWDAGFLGANSFAGGLDASARGPQSFAWGTEANAVAARSIALGDQVGALSPGSILLGRQVLSASDSAMILNTGGPADYATLSEPRSLALLTGALQPSIYIHPAPDAGTPGNVGIGGKPADERLRVNGNAAIQDTLKTNQLQVQQGPVTPGDVLVAADAAGTAEWQASPLTAPNEWSLEGNAGTVPRLNPPSGPPVGTNFLGTTDSQALAFATNDTTRMVLRPNGFLSLEARKNLLPTQIGGIYIGADTGTLSPTANTFGNTVVGIDAGMHLEHVNAAFGAGALRYASDAFRNAALGGSTLVNLLTGDENTAVGTFALRNLIEGDENVGVGHCAGCGLVAGEKNIFIGSRAGLRRPLFPADTGHGNILIGADIIFYSDVNRAIALGGDMEVQHSGAFVTADTNGTFSSSASNRFSARFAGGYQLYTNAAASIGVQVPAGGNSWATLSDSTLKTNYLPADPEAFLQQLEHLRLGSWNYTTQPASRRHYGPMAQEFYAAYGRDYYGSIGNATTLQSADVDGVLFILVKALKNRNEALQAENEALNNRLNALEARYNALEERLESLEAAQPAERRARR